MTQPCNTCGEVLTRQQVLDTADAYDRLIRHVTEITEIIWDLRVPGLDGRPPHFHFSFKGNNVYAAWYQYHDEVWEFPMDYLWSDPETIKQLEQVRIDDEIQRKADGHARFLAKAQLEKEASDRALYNKLRERFE